MTAASDISGLGIPPDRARSVVEAELRAVWDAMRGASASRGDPEDREDRDEFEAWLASPAGAALVAEGLDAGGVWIGEEWVDIVDLADPICLANPDGE